MRHSWNVRMVGIVAGFAVVSLASGCATKSYVRERVSELGNRVDSEHAGMRGDITRTGTLAQGASEEAARSRMLALGNVDFKTTEQFGVTFGFDSAELTPEARMTLDQVTSSVQDHSNYIVDVLGHACSIGPEAYNEDLSRRRASAVLHYLVQHGPGPVGRYAIVGLGESVPVVASGDEDHKASRRVEISLLERVDPGSSGSEPVISQADPDQ